MNANDILEIVLIIEPSGRLFPATSLALTRADGSRSEIRRRCIGNIIVSKNNSCKVTHVDFIGPPGESFIAKVWSILNSNWIITLETVPISIEVEALKAMAAAAVDDSEARSLLSTASSVTDVLRYFESLDSSEFLDVM